GELVCLREKAVPGLGERYNSQGLLLRDFNRLVGNERLSGKPSNVFIHLFAMSAVGILRQVRHGNHAELANFLEGVHLGIAEEIDAATGVILARGIAAFVVGGMLFANLVVFATASDFRHRVPAVSCVGRRWPMLADW